MIKNMLYTYDGPYGGACKDSKDQQIEYLNFRIQALEKQLEYERSNG